MVANKRRKDLRQRAVEYLGGKCCICGYSKCIGAMDFHHIESQIKDFTISSRMTSWEAIEKELRKCVLLCSNCHREAHDGLHPHYLQDETHMRSSYDGDDRQLDLF
jgi:hypothetical protein